jgi:hypothetical protein
MSFYSGPADYRNCSFLNHSWSWNPVTGGDQFGHKSLVLHADNSSGTSMSISTRPLQWACNNVPADCIFEKQITLDGNAVKVKATLINNRTSDHSVYHAYGQELPAMYSIGQFCTLTCYTGNQPFKRLPLQEWKNASGPNPWYPGHITCTEGWAAFIDPSTGFGMALFRPRGEMTFLAGFTGKLCQGGATDDPAGYIASVERLAIAWNEVYTYEFALVLGNINDIRSKIYQMRQDMEGDLRV